MEEQMGNHPLRIKISIFVLAITMIASTTGCSDNNADHGKKEPISSDISSTEAERLDSLASTVSAVDSNANIKNTSEEEQAVNIPDLPKGYKWIDWDIEKKEDGIDTGRYICLQRHLLLNTVGINSPRSRAAKSIGIDSYGMMSISMR
jgi:hypothetical protein